MSTRTAGRSRAVREAWKNEQRLVLEGKGTRDWTEEQQQQIAELGKAYDDKRVAFEGQHMKSASEHPEYHDDPRNIQFLSREEHFDAHGCKWTNPTNGYYDPSSKTMSDFGDGPPQPCAVVMLTNPLYVDALNEVRTHPSSSEIKAGSQVTDAPAAQTGGFLRRTQALLRVAQQASKNPQVRAVALLVASTAAKEALNRAATSVSGSRTKAPSTQPSMGAASAPRPDFSPGGRQAPEAHGVSGYVRKNGTSVRPYLRGGKQG